MELVDKTINFLGDSITEGHGTSSPDKCFVSRIQAATGCVCRNYGIGGTRIARKTKASKNTREDLDFNVRVLCMDHDADLIVVFGGTNDYCHGDAPLGTDQDRDVYTFYGALHCLYSSLREHYEMNQILVITPLHRYRSKDIGIEPSLEEYVNAIRVVAAHYNLPVLDLYELSELHPKTEHVMERYIPDGLHPNDDGHEILAREILAFLTEL